MVVWIYLIVQAVGLGIIAWCFKAEDKRGYATTFGIGGFLSLLLVVVVAPIPVKLLTGFLIVLFRSRINLTFAGGLEALLSYLRTSFQALTTLGSIDFDPVSRLMPKPLITFLSHYSFRQRQEQQTVNVESPNNNVIDIEAIEVTHWL